MTREERTRKQRSLSITLNMAAGLIRDALVYETQGLTEKAERRMQSAKDMLEKADHIRSELA